MEILTLKKTVKGYEVKDLKWLSEKGFYIGLVADPVWQSPTRQFITCSWNKDGKCFNRNRPDCDLIPDAEPVTKIKKSNKKKGVTK